MSDKIDQMWNSVEGLREGLTLAAREVERLTRVAQDALDALSRVEKERDEAREQWFRRGQQAAFVRAADISGQHFLRNLPLHGAPTEEEWARFLAGVAHENVKPLVEEEMRAINYEQPLGPTRLDTAEAEVERLREAVIQIADRIDQFDMPSVDDVRQVIRTACAALAIGKAVSDAFYACPTCGVGHGEVARLTKERDEARSERDTVWAQWRADAEHKVAAEKERDEARAMAQRPEEHGAAMQVRAERLEAALRGIRDRTRPGDSVHDIADSALGEGASP